MTEEQQKRKNQREKQNQWQREMYHYYKKIHLCTRCGKKDAYTISGHSRCFECSQKINETARNHYQKPENKAKKEERRKELHQQRIENKECVVCGRKLKTYETTLTCGVCLAKRRKTNKKYRDKKGIPPRVLFDGIDRCKKCGKEEVVAGYKVCNKCLTQCRKALETVQNRGGKNQKNWFYAEHKGWWNLIYATNKK